MIYIPIKLGNNKGFNLIAVLALLAIIGVMFAVAVQFIPTVVRREAIEITRQELDELRSALLEFYRDNAIFPSRLRDLETNPGLSHWDGPYIRSKFENYDYEQDEWGEDYSYSYTVDEWGADPCSLYSFGPNRQNNWGGGDDITVNVTPYEINIDPAGIKKEIERLVRNELRIVQEEAERYEAEQPNFPSNIGTLYTTISPITGTHYLVDESYRQDKWARDYISDGATFYSEGPDPTTSDDDIHLP